MSEHDEVVEAMAVAVFYLRCADVNATPTEIVRAAIRALPPGWVVAKVPKEKPRADQLSDSLWVARYADGHKDALAAIRASAVGVGE